MTTNSFARIGRLLYCIAMAGTGIQQLFYADFVGMIFPHWSTFFVYRIVACIFSLALIAASIVIVLERPAGRRIALILGGALFLMLVLGQVPYEYIVVPHKKTHLGIWVLPLKELALAGGAFAVAGSFPEEMDARPPLIRVLEKFIPFGRVFFSITMISFGYAHFLYAEGLQQLVPRWVPGTPIIWVYVTGTALILAGVAIIIRVQLRLAAMLLGCMILFWFFVVHLPRTIAHPLENSGNEIMSALSAVAFAGAAFAIADDRYKRYKKEGRQ